MGAGVTVSTLCCNLQVYQVTHTHYKSTLSLLLPHSLSLTTHISTTTYTELILGTHTCNPFPQSNTEWSHLAPLCQCGCLTRVRAHNSPLPRRQLAKMHTRAARSFPRQGVYLSCRRGARSASPPWLPCCRTLVCASSLSHKSPGTDGRRVVG